MTGFSFNLSDYVMPLVLIAAALLAWRLLVGRHKDAQSSIDLDDLLLGDDGRISKAAIILYVGLVITSWGFILLIFRDKMSDAIFIGYGALWVAPLLVKIVKGPIDNTAINNLTHNTTSARTQEQEEAKRVPDNPDP